VREGVILKYQLSLAVLANGVITDYEYDLYIYWLRLLSQSLSVNQILV